MEGSDLEVDFDMDLQVTVSDESNVKGDDVDARLAAGSTVESIAKSAPGSMTLEARTVADAIWHHKLANRGSQAGAIGHYEHSIRDNQSTKVAESIGFPAVSIADLHLWLAPQGAISFPSALLHLLTSLLLVYRCL